MLLFQFRSEFHTITFRAVYHMQVSARTLFSETALDSVRIIHESEFVGNVSAMGLHRPRLVLYRLFPY